MKLVATVLASIVAAFGVIGMFWPDGLILVGREASTPLGLYAVAALRVLFGASLLLSAHDSHAPTPLRVLGAILVVAGIATPLVGSRHASELIARFAVQDELWQRAAASIAAALGIFVVWALSPKAGPPRR